MPSNRFRVFPIMGILIGATAASPSTAQQTAAASDQLEAFIKISDAHIAEHPYFRKVTMLKWDKNPPLVFYIERPQKDDPYYQPMIVNSYRPFLERLLTVFEREYATPLKLTRRGAAPGFAIAVLNSRGSYLNYAQAVKASSLHNFRAHYDPRLQLAVTYVDAFANGNTGPDTRQSILHEFIHAMQHAYNVTGHMPRSTWFNEGLAEFHSNSTNNASSLDQPALGQDHLILLAGILTYADANSLFSPLPDLIAAESYADVLAKARKRGARAKLVMPVFYAQSAALVEFLRRGADGRYRPKFLQFTNAMMRGSRSTSGFEKVFGKDQIAALDAEFRKYLITESERRLHLQVGTAGAAMSAELAGKIGAMPPPEPFVVDQIHWKDSELGLRVAAARARCTRGEYGGALKMLPAAATTDQGKPTTTAALAERLRQRITEILRLREALLAKLLKSKKRMAPLVNGKRMGGTLVERRGGELLLKDGKTEFTLPLNTLSPKNLAKELSKQKLLERGSWQNAWLRWAGGESPRSAVRYLTGSDAAAVGLRADAQAVIDPEAAAPAAALARILELVPASAPAAAYRQLEAVCAAIRRHRNSPLFSSRSEGLRAYTKALAQRAFALNDPRCLGLKGKSSRGTDGRIAVTYSGGADALTQDFRLDPILSKDLASSFSSLATDRNSLTRHGKFHELVGAGIYSFPVPLHGAVVAELDFEMVGSGQWGLMIAMQPGGGSIRARMSGVIDIFDPKTRLNDSVGTSKLVYLDKIHKLRLEFDGKSTIRCFFDGKLTATLTRVGALTHGSVALMTHSSTPLRVHSLRLEGQLDHSAAPSLRQSFVQRTLDSLK